MKFYKHLLTSIGLVALLVTSTLYAKSDDSLQSDPIFKDFQKLQDDMNKIFESFHTKFFEDVSFRPKADLKDRGDYYEVKVDLPGVEKAETKVEVKDNILTIEAKSQKVKEKKDDKMIKKERFVGEFYKSMMLPKDADGEKLTTEYKDGVLLVKVPKK